MHSALNTTNQTPAPGAGSPRRVLRLSPSGWLTIAASLCLLVAAGYGARQLALHALEQEGIEVKAMGRETPLDFGVPYEPVVVPVYGRVLQARLVRADKASARALLIFHGNGEAVSDWSQVQAQLQAAGVSSMVFDYSGFGDSTGTPTVARLREDALAAYQAFVQQLPEAEALYVLGHSLGNAVMLDALHALQPQPAGVVVHAGFTSAREMAIQTGLAASWMAGLLPDVWDNEIAIGQTGRQMLVMHGDADEVIPPQMGMRLAHAAGPHAHFLGLPGIKHDSLYLSPTPREWQPIVNFVKASAALPVAETAGGQP